MDLDLLASVDFPEEGTDKKVVEDEEDEDMEAAVEEEVEDDQGFIGRRNERLAKIMPHIEKRSHHDAQSAISAKKGGNSKRPEAEEDHDKKKEDEVRVVSTSKGGEMPCYVCGKVFAIMPKNCKFCYTHKRVLDTLVKKWTPKRSKNKKEKKTRRGDQD